jgi:hypothetical protein
MSFLERLNKFPTSILNRDENSVVGRLWKIYSIMLDEIFEQANLILGIYDLLNTEGANLDLIGSLVNETRIPGQSDEDFRLFISIAILKRISRGSLPEIISIGKIIAGLNGTLFVTTEGWKKTGELFLDGLSTLNGLEPLNPSAKRPATVELIVAGEPNNVQSPLLLGSTIDQIRAAGVNAKVRVRFNFGNLTLVYTSRHSKLNGLGKLDGLTLLNPQANLNVDEGRIGDGATTNPELSDTDLKNIINSKLLQITNNGDGTRTYLFTIGEIENNGENVNEFGMFAPDNRLVFYNIFSNKPKVGTLIYDFEYTEEVIV